MTDWRQFLVEILAADERFFEHVNSHEQGEDADCGDCALYSQQFESALVAARKAFKDEAFDAGVRKSRDRSLF